MIKLYRRVAQGQTRYHEAWVEGDVVVEHWGAIGERGATRRHPINLSLSEEENLEKVLGAARREGCRPIPIEDHAVLLIEYSVQGMGTAADVEKRHRLQDRLDNVLGWAGIGHCDGGSIGSGTMEACCYVVDFGVAQRLVAEDLSGTEFADYTRIYEEA
jgi:hypothetical protein